jgi:hypothetical protein
VEEWVADPAVAKEVAQLYAETATSWVLPHAATPQPQASYLSWLSDFHQDAQQLLGWLRQQQNVGVLLQQALVEVLVLAGEVLLAGWKEGSGEREFAWKRQGMLEAVQQEELSPLVTGTMAILKVGGGNCEVCALLTMF